MTELEHKDLKDRLESLEGMIKATQAAITISEKESQASLHRVESSVDSMTSKIRKILDDNAASVTEKESLLRESVTEEIAQLTSEINDLQQAITTTNHKVKRYFDKEKYAITKGIITKIIKEEKLHG